MGLIETGLYTWLATTQDFADGRVYPNLLPQDPTLPAIVYQKISSDIFTGMTHGGASGLTQQVFQIDVFAQTYVAAKNLAKSIRDALDGFKGTMGIEDVRAAFVTDDRDIYEDTTKLHRVSVDVSIWHKE